MPGQPQSSGGINLSCPHDAGNLLSAFRYQTGVPSDVPSVPRRLVTPCGPPGHLLGFLVVPQLSSGFLRGAQFRRRLLTIRRGQRLSSKIKHGKTALGLPDTDAYNCPPIKLPFEFGASVSYQTGSTGTERLGPPNHTQFLRSAWIATGNCPAAGGPTRASDRCWFRATDRWRHVASRQSKQCPRHATACGSGVGSRGWQRAPGPAKVAVGRVRLLGAIWFESKRNGCFLGWTGLLFSGFGDFLMASEKAGSFRRPARVLPVDSALICCPLEDEGLGGRGSAPISADSSERGLFERDERRLADVYDNDRAAFA